MRGYELFAQSGLSAGQMNDDDKRDTMNESGDEKDQMESGRTDPEPFLR